MPIKPQRFRITLNNLLALCKMQRLLDVLHDLCSMMNLKLVSRAGYKIGYTSTNKNIVTVERNSTREA